MTSYTPELRAELDAAMAKATDGPWLYRPHEYDDWGYIRGPANADGISYIAAVSSSNGLQDHNEHRRNGTDPYEENGMAIVAAVNSIKPLTEKIDADAIRIEALEGEVARLREALQPFAREAACWDADANDGYDFPDHEPLEMESALQVKHLRIARAVHASTGAS